MDISVSSFLGVAIRGTNIGDFSASAGGMVGISQDFNPPATFREGFVIHKILGFV